MSARDVAKRILNKQGWYFTLWHLEDVSGRSRYYPDIEFTDDFCKEVLEACVLNHDAQQGINWDMIDFWIEELS